MHGDSIRSRRRVMPYVHGAARRMSAQMRILKEPGTGAGGGQGSHRSMKKTDDPMLGESMRRSRSPPRGTTPAAAEKAHEEAELSAWHKKKRAPERHVPELPEERRLPTLPPGLAVPSAMTGLASLFGMGRGGSPSL